MSNPTTTTTATTQSPAPRKAGGPPPKPELDYSDLPQVVWLRARGWRMTGDPRLNTDRWYDPTKPRKAVDDPKGKKLDIPPRKNDKGVYEDCYQTVHTAAGEPMSRQAAVDLQAERDLEAEEKA